MRPIWMLVKIRDIKEGAGILAMRSEMPIPLILSVGLFESDKYLLMNNQL